MVEYIIILVAIILLVKFIHNLRHNRDVFFHSWPIIGMLPSVLHNICNIHDYVTLGLKYYGGTFLFKGPWCTNTTFIVTSDPMNVQHILSKNYGNYGKGSEFLEIFEVIGGGILNSDSSEWKLQRKLLHTFFTRKNFEIFLLKTIETKLENCLLPLLGHHALKAGSQVDLQDIFERFTFDTTCTFIFGFDPKSLPYRCTELSEIAYVKALPQLEEVMLYRHITPTWFWKLLNMLQLGQEKKYNVAKENLERFIRERIEDCKHEEKKRFSNNEKKLVQEVEESRFDVMKMLMSEEVGKSDKFLRDMSWNLLLAGNSTINASLSWFFWLVSTHPIVEGKIIQEIRDNKCLTQDGNCNLSSVEMLDKMVYLHGAICETLRLYPPVPFEHKCAIKSDILPSGDHVSPNTKILYCLYSMGRTEKIWGEDCLEFKPERWISEKGLVVMVPSHKFITFNAGPRSCLGKDVTLIQMKMVAIAVLSKFHIQVVEGHPITPTTSIILTMKHGLKVKVTKRCKLALSLI